MNLNTYWEAWEIKFESEIRVTGSGTIEDPMILLPKTYWNNNYFSISISDSKKYIEIKKINLKSLHLSNCKNVTISESNVKNLDLKRCSTFLIQKSRIKKLLNFSNCHQIKLDNCTIKKIFAISSSQILFSHCEIKKISKKCNDFNYKKTEEELLLYTDSIPADNHSTQNFWTCQYCNTEADLKSNFCHECGKRLRTNS